MTDLKALQMMQEQRDEKHWNDFESMEDVRHTSLHITKIAGKLAAVCEQYEHNKDVRVPVELARTLPADLLIIALHLCNNSGYSLETLYLERIAELNKKSGDESAK